MSSTETTFDKKKFIEYCRSCYNHTCYMGNKIFCTAKQTLCDNVANECKGCDSFKNGDITYTF